MSLDASIENLLKRDRFVVLAGLIVLTVLAWLYLVTLSAHMRSMGGGTSDAAEMPGMSGMSGMNTMSDDTERSSFRAWTVSDTLFTFGMWAVMMVAMMLPSAAPVILLYARVVRKRIEPPYVPTAAFLAGYVAVWALFSAAATALQALLEALALLSPMLVATSALLNAVFLIAAGVYQWLPTKGACLRHCRSPVDFLSRHWQHGSQGAFLMGLRHGVYCVGCCWGLMLLLFVGGVMNLLWLAAIAVFILIEKASHFGQTFGRVSGALLIVFGIVSFFGA
jgi:predicted metal-binding membrane protein